MSGVTATPGGQGPWRAAWSWLAEGIAAAARGLAFCLLMLAGTPPLLAVVLFLALVVNRSDPTTR